MPISKILPPNISIETNGHCNRRCPTCLRNSHPSRVNDNDSMPYALYLSILHQLADYGWSRRLNLQHYNEPFCHDALLVYAADARTVLPDAYIYVHTNGDPVTEEAAKYAAQIFDEVIWSDYERSDAKYERLSRWFAGGRCTFTRRQDPHSIRHYAPNPRRAAKIASALDQPCHHPQDRLIIDRHGECLLCCEDVCGEFSLGNAANKNLVELWTGRRMEVAEALLVPGGRRKFAYCATCPWL